MCRQARGKTLPRLNQVHAITLVAAVKCAPRQGHLLFFAYVEGASALLSSGGGTWYLALASLAAGHPVITRHRVVVSLRVAVAGRFVGYGRVPLRRSRFGKAYLRLCVVAAFAQGQRYEDAFALREDLYASMEIVGNGRPHPGPRWVRGVVLLGPVDSCAVSPGRGEHAGDADIDHRVVASIDANVSDRGPDDRPGGTASRTDRRDRYRSFPPRPRRPPPPCIITLVTATGPAAGRQ